MSEINALGELDRGVSPRIASFVSRDLHCLPKETLLSEADRENLKAIVRAKSTSSKSVSLTKAMTLLAREERSAEVCNLLAGVLGSHNIDPVTRAVAAQNLVMMPSEAAELALLAHIGVEQALVLSHVIKSLGCVGGKQALSHLETLGIQQEEFVQKQLAFSKALITHRLGLLGDPLPFQEGEKREAGPNDQMLGFSLRMLQPKSLQKCRLLFTGSTYNIELSTTLGFEVIAGQSRWVLFVNQALEAGGLHASIGQRKFITGLLTLENKRARSLVTQHVVLSKPAADGIELMVVRTDGEVYYSGRACAKDSVLNFSMADIDRKGTAPTNIEGRLTPEGVVLDVRIPFRNRIGKRAPEPVIV